jgi:hypothetical protein
MTDIVFAPLGDADWITPVAKGGKAGRDGDGDGILNEGNKPMTREDADRGAAVALAGIAGAVGGSKVGGKLGERFAVRGSGARGKQWLAAAHHMTPAGMSPRPAVRTAMNLFSASEAARSAKFGAKGRLGGGLLGLVAGGALAGYGVSRALNKSDTPTFSPIGAEDFIQKDGRKGRDGDDVLNESKKKRGAGERVGQAIGQTVGGITGLVAGATGGAIAGKKVASKINSMQTAGRAGESGLASALRREAMKGTLASRRAKLMTVGAALGASVLGYLSAKMDGEIGALAGRGVDRAAGYIKDNVVSGYGSLTKAYADDVIDILQSDIEDKASEIAKSGEMLAEIVSSLNPRAEFEKADGPVDFATSVARIEFSKACAEIEQITSEMVETLTKSVENDPSTLYDAVEEFDADMGEFLSALDEDDDEDDQPVEKAAAPVFVPLA